MKIIVTNKLILIKDPTSDIKMMLNDKLSYTDKAKQYQVRRMSRSSYLRNTDKYRQLKEEIHGNLCKELPGGHLAMPSGFLYLIKDLEVEDKKVETGSNISLPWIDKPNKLRGYQEEAIEVMKDNWKGIINMATGLGKSLIMVYACREFKKKTLIVVPSESIALQFERDLVAAFGKNRVAMYGAGKKKIADITVGIAASVVRNIDKFKAADLGLVMYDEQHHIAADTFYAIANGLSDVGRTYGFTATDYRGDGKDIFLNAGCGDVILKRDIKWGIENKWLAKPVFKIVKVDTKGFDYDDNKLKCYKEHILNDRNMNEAILGEAQALLSEGRTLMILVAEIEHGEAISKVLGCPFAQSGNKDSHSYVTLMNKGKIKCLVATAGLVSEGTDIKNIDAIILASFVLGKGPVIQSIGRGLRIFTGKVDCKVIDFIPLGSSMLTRHAESRVEYYQEITDDIKIIHLEESNVKIKL